MPLRFCPNVKFSLLLGGATLVPLWCRFATFEEFWILCFLKIVEIGVVFAKKVSFWCHFGVVFDTKVADMYTFTGDWCYWC